MSGLNHIFPKNGKVKSPTRILDAGHDCATRKRWITVELLLVVYLCYSAVCQGLNFISIGLTGYSIIGQLLLFAYVLILMLAAIVIVRDAKTLHARFPVDSIVLLFCFAMAYALSSLVSTNYDIIVAQNLPLHTFVECMPIYLLFRLCRDYDRLWRCLTNGSIAIFFLYLMSFLVCNVGATAHYKNFSAGLLFPSTVFMIKWLREQDRRFALPCVASVLLMVTYGRRSSILSIAILLVLLLFAGGRYKALVISVVVAVLLYCYWTPILEFANDIVLRLGVKSRSLLRIQDATFTTDVGRDAMWRQVISAMMATTRTMLLGLGIAGDRQHVFVWSVKGGHAYPYPHSLVIEMLGQYGIVFGTILLFALLVVLPVMAFKRIDSTSSMMSIFCFSVALFTPLLIQDSYLQYKFFYLYIGVLATALIDTSSFGKTRTINKSSKMEHNGLSRVNARSS